VVIEKPKSGKTAELLDYEGISGKAIVKQVKEKLKGLSRREYRGDGKRAFTKRPRPSALHA
jgi:hypothetical protein